jgi:hypothetical protein
MEIPRAVADVLLGASLREIAADCRQELIAAGGLRAADVKPEAFRDEVAAFMRQLARHLGERHRGEPRVGQALREWVAETEHYEAWDALLSGFVFEGKAGLLRRGRLLFPGPLTAHWAES